MTAKRVPFLLFTLLWITFFAFSAESPFWSQYEIIDIHAHIGTFRGYDLSKETLLSNLRESGVRFALISNIDGAGIPLTLNLPEKEANQATADAVRGNPNLLRGLAWARVEDGSPLIVETFLKQKLNSGSQIFVGIKFHPEFNHFPADDPRINAYLQLCKNYNVPAVFHCGRKGTNSDPLRIYAAARRFPTVPVILYHMGFFGPHETAISVAKEALQRKDANIYLETAQAKPDAVMKAISILGSDRVLFGTDASYYGREHYLRYSELLQRLHDDLAGEDFARVTRQNAEQLFHLQEILRSGK